MLMWQQYLQVLGEAKPTATDIGFGRKATAPDSDEQPLLGAATGSRDDKNAASAVTVGRSEGTKDKGEWPQCQSVLALGYATFGKLPHQIC